MESGIQSSFIPQDAGKQIRVPGSRSSGTGLSDLLLLLSIVMFVASAALGGAVFLYKQYLGTSAASKLDQLQRAKEAFDPVLIQELTRLDDRMHAADQILRSHIAPTAFFDALEQATLTTVAFQNLDIEASDLQRIRVKMQGVAQSVNSIALQADIFSKNGVITSPIFSDINRQVDGVHFNLNALVNPAAVNYVQILSGASGVPEIPQQTRETQTVQQSPFGGTSNTEASQQATTTGAGTQQ